MTNARALFDSPVFTGHKEENVLRKTVLQVLPFTIAHNKMKEHCVIMGPQKLGLVLPL